MATLSFKLVNKGNGDSIKESHTLLGIFNHIRLHINEPRSWMVEEFEDGESVDQCCAHYLMENFKPDTLPKTVTDISGNL